MTRRPALSPWRRDAWCALGIAVAAITLWWPALDIVSLNPDESQYEATASYLAATDTTVFLPNGAPGVFGIWTMMTRLVGPYPIHAMRVMLLFVALAIGLALFGTVRDAAGRVAGVIAAVTFLYYVQAFEGLVVNREWFASLFTILGLVLYLRLDARTRPRAWPFAVAGFLCGMALWFKLQVGFMVFVAPLTMALTAAGDRSLARLGRQLPAFALGGIASAAAYLGPFLAQGALGQFLRLVFTDVAVFAGANADVIRGDDGGPWWYVQRFLLGQYGRGLLLIAYLAAAAILAAACLRAAGRRGELVERMARPTPVLFAVYLALAMTSVKLGNRFLAHYFQLMLPAVAALVGLSVAFLWRATRDRRGWQWAALAVAATLLADRALTASSDPTWSDGWPASTVPAALLVAGVVVIAAFWIRRPLSLATPALALLIGLQVSVMAVREQLTPTPASMSHNPYAFDDLTRFLRAESEPGDLLFVWGWAPEIYSLSRLTAASHITFAQYVANDLKGVPNRPVLSREWADLLMRELRVTRPRFIVDASRRSWYETEPWIYRLRNFPDFELLTMLRQEYRRVGRFDDCDVWERVAPDMPSG